MERHERICWRNPDRHCSTCNDTGRVVEDDWDMPCFWCSQRNPDMPPLTHNAALRRPQEAR